MDKNDTKLDTQTDTQAEIQKGAISINARGKGFVRLESRAKLGREGDVPVQPEDIGEAFQGDIVEVGLYKGFRGMEHAQIIRVLEQKKNTFVGTLSEDSSNGESYFVEPDDKRANVIIEIPKKSISVEMTAQIKPNLKVQVSLDSWTRLPHDVSRATRDDKRNRERYAFENGGGNDANDNNGASSGNSNGGFGGGNSTSIDALGPDTLDFSITRLATGSLLKIIGERGQNNTEMEAIVLERGFDVTFPPEVVRDAEKATAEHSQITAEEISKRIDMRGVFTCTIDPFDAKDFDDALSIREVTEEQRSEFPEAIYEIGVHIADVSHFVRPGTALDEEAKRRAFSVYLVDRTIPMLPSILSNGACSLNPNEDRYAYSAIFLITKQGEILNRTFGKSIIHSDKRFTYENAQEVLSVNGAIAENQNAIDQLNWKDESTMYAKELLEMNRIAKIYLKQKKENGAIDFETTEIKFKLDEHGYPIGVYKKDRIDTHRLVEEYMLLANREVSKFVSEKNKIGQQERPGVYRVHDQPDPDRIKELGLYVRALGFDFPIDDKNANKVTPKQIQSLLKQVEGKPEESMVKISTLRSMAKAIYATHDQGHFGLAYDHYTHFTSPIRRYPDLMVHRILSMVLVGGAVSAQESPQYTKICENSSRREVEAADAERASVKYKQVEYMMKKIGQEFDVTVSGISDFGMFVQEPEALAEGLIRVRDLKPEDFYAVDTKKFKIVGERSKKEFHIGDILHVKLVDANLEDKMLNFQIVEGVQKGE